MCVALVTRTTRRLLMGSTAGPAASPCTILASQLYVLAGAVSIAPGGGEGGGIKGGDSGKGGVSGSRGPGTDSSSRITPSSIEFARATSDGSSRRSTLPDGQRTY